MQCRKDWQKHGGGTDYLALAAIETNSYSLGEDKVLDAFVTKSVKYDPIFLHI